MCRGLGMVGGSLFIGMEINDFDLFDFCVVSGGLCFVICISVICFLHSGW